MLSPHDPIARLLKGSAARYPLCRVPSATPSETLAMCAAQLVAAARAAATPRSVYDFSARPLAGGDPVNLGSLRGKVLLIENVASL